MKDGVLEELSPKNVIPPEELEKIPNPNPETREETPMVTTGRTISPRPLTEQEKRAVIAMQAHLRCEYLLRGKAKRTSKTTQAAAEACRCAVVMLRWCEGTRLGGVGVPAAVTNTAGA